MRLANDELQYAAADLERAWEQSVIQGAGCFRQGDFTKYQIELANQASLRKRQTKAQSQVAALNVRTPVAGRVVARNLATLAGQYLPQGAEIAIVGDEAAGWVVGAVAQENARPFLVQLGKPVAFRIRGTAEKEHEGPLYKTRSAGKLGTSTSGVAQFTRWRSRCRQNEELDLRRRRRATGAALRVACTAVQRYGVAQSACAK